MAPWQRRARLVIAVSAIAFAIALAFAFRPRTPEVPPTVVERSDPTALVETGAGRTFRINRNKEEIRIDHEKVLTYPDGSTRLEGVTVTTERDNGRVFVIRGDRGEVGDKESNVALEGHVQLTGNDGMTVTTERATFDESDGMLRVPGAVEFTRGRMSGTSLGLTYDKNTDVMSLLDQVNVHMVPEDGEAGLQITSGSAIFRRAEQIVQFDTALQVIRDTRAMGADAGVARLDEEGSSLRTLELRGNARIADTPEGPGGLELMTAQNMDLRYAEDGETLERAVLTGNAVVQLAGQAGQGSRRIVARSLDISLANGTTPVAVIARDNVELVIPAETASGATRTIRADALDAAGQAQSGLRTAHFTGRVQFREQGGNFGRAARSEILDVTLAPGLGAIQEARFSREVRFEEGAMAADAAAARYVLEKGTLELSGAEPGRERPHVVHNRIGVFATAITIELDGPQVHATGDVKSVLQPEKGAPGAEKTKVPSMLKRDEIVNVTAAELQYAGKASKATYSGKALLWQGDTSVKADTITIDSEKGDMAGDGAVATSVMLEQTTDAGKKERTRSTTTSKRFVYEETPRRATYTGEAHMSSPQGDMTAEKIELYLKPSGNELDKAEAYETVTLREKSRKTTGARMTYFSQDERYVMTGTPVTIVDECRRETTGRTLTFFRTTDRIVVDGSEQVRTQTRGGTQCSGT
jgi:LPS export ABC transporter protein LptC/lipopolysaccharide transport protein LptA